MEAATCMLTASFPAQDELNVSINGSGQVKFDTRSNTPPFMQTFQDREMLIWTKYYCQRSDIRISGSGDVRIRAEERLKVRISGSGKVYYTGNPVIESEISGSGMIIKY